MGNLFDQLDADADGRIDAPELLAVALSLGRRWTETQAVAALRVIDTDGDGLVGFNEVYSWYAAGGMSKILEVPLAAAAAAAAAAVDPAARRLTREEAESIFQVDACRPVLMEEAQMWKSTWR
jgi:Ca2+-binding EF-hand superfamily protein